MKSYKQFVAESNRAMDNLQEGWGSGLRSVGRSLGAQWVKRSPDIMTGIYGLQRAAQAVTNPDGYDEAGMYLGLGQAAPFLGPGGRINPLSTAIKVGSMVADGKRRYDAYQKYLKKKQKEEESKAK